jgi:hypothetical protein
MSLAGRQLKITLHVVAPRRGGCVQATPFSVPPASPYYARLHQSRHQSWRLHAGGDDPDLAVFRFTLGIPGFDDALIPRVVGVAGAALLLLNHLLAEGSPSAAQGRAEALGAVLAAVAVATPALEQRLLEAQPGRGRAAAADAVAGGSNVFALRDSLTESTKRELAWASYALLRNANICGLAVVWDGDVVMCRGLVGAQVAGAGAGKALDVATQVWHGLSLGGCDAYSSNRAGIAQQGLGACALVPAGVQSLLLQPLAPLDGAIASDAPRGTLLLLSERERALSSKERSWAQALAAKLHGSLS